MSFTGNENHDFTLTEASEWTANFRAAHPSSILGHFFGKTALEAVLAQTGCVGIRIYYALDDGGAKQLIVVGVDSSEDDMTAGLIKERSCPSPPYSGGKNCLNGDDK